jgi:hypothetical protein
MSIAKALTRTSRISKKINQSRKREKEIAIFTTAYIMPDKYHDDKEFKFSLLS